MAAGRFWAFAKARFPTALKERLRTFEAEAVRGQLPEEAAHEPGPLQEGAGRLIVAALAVVVGLIVSVFFGGRIIEFLKEPAEARNPDFALQAVEPFEAFVAYFRVSLLGVSSSPCPSSSTRP